MSIRYTWASNRGRLSLSVIKVRVAVDFYVYPLHRDELQLDFYVYLLYRDE
jgi:hypothetical protein